MLEHLTTGPYLPLEPMDTNQPHIQTINEKIAIKFMEESGLRIILTLLLSGSGNVFANPLPIQQKVGT